MVHLLPFLLLLTISNTQLYDPSLYSLGSNLIVNPTFSTPDIGGAMTQYFSSSIYGWNFASGQIVTVSALCSNFGHTCTHNFTQALDMDAMFALEIISQSVSISSSNQFLLSV